VIKSALDERVTRSRGWREWNETFAAFRHVRGFDRGEHRGFAGPGVAYQHAHEITALQDRSAALR